MRIINLEQFRKQPIGTVFCKYEPCMFGELQVFGGISGNHDFLSADITHPKYEGSNDLIDILLNAEKSGKSFEMEMDCFSRDGLFEEGELFAVYENNDLTQLIEVLTKAINLPTIN